MTNPPPLTYSLNKALDAAIQNLFNNLIANLAAPTYSQDKSTPIARFERGLQDGASGLRAGEQGD